MPTPIFTVFTPTYNRAHTLHRCYESLKAQTFRDFEWLIVDDGSTDGTADLVAAWQAEGLVPMRYEPLPHGGAHRVHNHCLQSACGQLYIKLDSDDACEPQALERYWFHWNAIPEAERAGFSGVTALCHDQNGQLVGTLFPSDPLDCTAAELEYVHKVTGEKWGFLRLDVLKQFPFPEADGNFVPESYVWSQVSTRYKTRHINEQLRVWWMDAPSLVHGPSDPAKNADGHRLMYQMVLNLEARYVTAAPIKLYKVAGLYSRFSHHCGVGLLAQALGVHGILPRLLWLLAAPIGTLLYWRDRLRKSRS
ncbi:MAG: glycosyltransferase family A protein [Verrucomicrobia bacterium]|nr:glycosyltransferase family A protein [Verrucomicrobiota bacterium]